MAGGGSEAVFDLRPLNLADLFDAVIRLYRLHFGDIIRIAAVVYVPLGILQIASAAVLFQDFDADSPIPELPGISVIGAIGYTLFFVLFFLSIPLMQAAVAKAVAEIYLGGRITLGSVYRFALRCWTRLIAVTVLSGIIVSGVVVLGTAIPVAGVMMAKGVTVGSWIPAPGVAEIVAGVLGFIVSLQVSIVVTVKLFFGPLVVVLEDERTLRALGRSWQLTGGHFWRVLIALSLLWLLVTVLTGIIVWPAQVASIFLQEISFNLSQAILNGLSAFAQLFIQPIHIIGTVLLYYDLRMRKEGFDLVMMAEAIGEPHLAVRTPSGEAQPALYGPVTLEAGEVVGSEPADSDQLPRD